ncbi:MAG: redoxin domain-containing protein [Acidimicrobiia bacterium]
MRWTLAAVGVGLIVVTVAFATRFGRDPSLIASPLIGRPIPEVALPYLEHDAELALHELEGEIVVVNFWASWCLACRPEHAELAAIADAYRDLAVRVVGISWHDRPASAIDFLDELGRGYDFVVDEGSRAGIGFGVRGVPETFFIDRQGTVVAKVTGPVTRQLVGATIDRILLGQEVESVNTGTVESQP